MASGSPSLRACTLADLDEVAQETFAVFWFSDARPLAGAAGLVDWRVHGAISRAIGEGVFRGDLGEVMLLPVTGRLGARRIFVFGLGASTGCQEEFLRQACEQAATTMRKAGVGRIAWVVPAVVGNASVEAIFLRAVAAVAREGVDDVLTEAPEEGASGQ